MIDAAPDGLVTSLRRGLAVLRCFGESREALGASDVARLTGLPQPTAWRLCKTLAAEGYLIAEGQGARYRPGLAVLTLGYAALDRFDVGQLVCPFLQEIARAYRGAASLTMRAGSSMLYIARREADLVVLAPNLRVGSRVPLISASTGWTYLAGLPQQQRAELLKALQAEDRALYRKSIGPFRKALAAFNQRGYISNQSVIFPGVTTIAAPLRTTRSAELYVVSFSAMSGAVSSAKIRAEIGERVLALALRAAAI